MSSIKTTTGTKRRKTSKRKEVPKNPTHLVATMRKKGHPPYKCWRRLDAKCSKCNQLGHEAVICKVKGQVQEVDAQVVGQEEDHLFVVTCFSSRESSES